MNKFVNNLGNTDNFKGIPRGPKKFYYTYADIGKLRGIKPETVREYASRGKFNPASLGSVIRFISGSEAFAIEEESNG